MGKTLPPRLVPPPPMYSHRRVRPWPPPPRGKIDAICRPVLAPPCHVDLSNLEHRRAWAEYEAHREYDALKTGDVYKPFDVADLRICRGVIRHKSDPPAPVPMEPPRDLII